MSHSSVERVILPDACLLMDYALARLSGILENLIVDRVQMISLLKQNASLAFSSQRLFEALTNTPGCSRKEIYQQIQKLSFDVGASALTEDEFSRRSEQVLQSIDRIFNFDSDIANATHQHRANSPKGSPV